MHSAVHAFSNACSTACLHRRTSCTYAVQIAFIFLFLNFFTVSNSINLIIRERNATEEITMAVAIFLLALSRQQCLPRPFPLTLQWNDHRWLLTHVQVCAQSPTHGSSRRRLHKTTTRCSLKTRTPHLDRCMTTDHKINTGKYSGEIWCQSSYITSIFLFSRNELMLFLDLRELNASKSHQVYVAYSHV